MIRRLPEVIAILLLTLFFYTRLPSYEWNRVIHSDGKGYYAHLPALFIYNDLEYGFNDEIEKKYYPADGHLAKNYRFKFKGETVNKTFSGITILWLPFFLLAHFLSYIFGLEVDGYSILYQLSIGISAIFYFWLGCKLLLKLLNLYDIPKKTAAFVLIAITFGTNLFYYLLLDPSLTHSYNFVIITAFIYFVKLYSDQPNKKPLLLATACLALILSIRPQDGFIALSVPFIAGSWEQLKAFFTNIFRSYKTLLLQIFIFLLIIAVPISLWYAQTGYFIVYSYGDEGFDFSNPQFFNVLFSYKKGLFVYSPIVFLTLLGFLPLYKKSKFQLIGLSIFFMITTYIISSWEEWWYGCSYGHRVFIDFYAFPAILLALFYKEISGKLYLKRVLSVIITVLIGYNCIQMYQHQEYIVPACDNNKALYWSNFLKLTPDARVDLPAKDNEVLQLIHHDLELQKTLWEGWSTTSDEAAYSGKLSSKVSTDQPFSIAYKGPIDSSCNKIVVSAMIFTNHSDVSPRIVVDLQSKEQSIHYKAFYLERYMQSNNWFQVEFATEINANIPKDNKLVMYLWHPEGKNAVYIDDINIKIIKEKRE